MSEIARDYYNSDDADAFYAKVWGGEDIHIGLYEEGDASIFEASRRTVERMAALAEIQPTTQVLDIGSGYGGAARHLVEKFGCSVHCLNLSEVQNERNRSLNAAAGVQDKIEVVDGAFESIPCEDDRFDLVWSQDAVLHSRNKPKVFEEVRRVLKPGGVFIFTDPMQSDDCPPGVLQPILDRIHLDALGSFGLYRRIAKELGLSEVSVLDLTEHLIRHYSAVRQELVRRREELLSFCSEAYLSRMDQGLLRWVEGGEAGHLAWGILRFQLKPL